MDWKNYAGQHALADFVPLEHQGARMMVRRGYEDAARLLVERKNLPTVEMLGGGREAHPVVVLPTGEKAVVRRYHRGGLMQRVNKARYFGGNRAFDELRAAERARAGGVRTPVVVAAIERPARVAGYRAWLATVLLSGGLNLAAWLAAETDEARRSGVLREAGRQTALMHAAGVAHADLNLRNLLVMPADGGDEVYLLDFDKATVSATPVSRTRRERDLRRLARSARKLEAGLGPEHWAVFREGYGEDWPPGVDLAKVPKEERGKDA